jgi:hypothetical protein
VSVFFRKNMMVSPLLARCSSRADVAVVLACEQYKIVKEGSVTGNGYGGAYPLKPFANVIRN